jgi:UDP-N-acetylglucosamine--N-acetylmuramyl-(pentapeptide) pyrophosphoryl-undecaprenol N-acetylglucosamine transferase
MKLAITGGGTGGHLAIAAALLEALKQKGHEAIYIGSTSGQDRSWFGDETNFEKRYFLDTSGVVNRKYLGKVWALWKIFRAVITSRKILKRENIDAVVSVGGYSAAAATFAAYTKQVPFFIHEQNAVMGRLNTMMKPYALFTAHMMKNHQSKTTLSVMCSLQRHISEKRSRRLPF